MSGADINFDYAKLEDMVRLLAKGAQQLEQTKQQVAKSANGFTQGSFEGQAGQGLADGLANQLGPAIDRLIQKFNEMGSDIAKAATEMQELDSGKVASQF